MKLSAVVSILVAVFITLLFVGHVIGLPIIVAFAVGSSMYPTLRGGDLVVAVSTSLVGVRPGDIAIYERDGKAIVHRVLSVVGDKAIFMGDNNDAPDPPVPLSAIKYKVVLRLGPAVWVPILSALLTFYGCVLSREARRSRAAGHESMVSTIYFIGLIVFILILSIHVGTVSVGHVMKPPGVFPDIALVYVKNNVVYVKLARSIVFTNVTCSVIYPAIASAPCSHSGDSIAVAIPSKVLDLCGKPCRATLEITGRIGEAYINYTIDVALGGGR